jgi:hypothetical protein
LQQNEQLAFFLPGLLRLPVVKSLPVGIPLPSALPIVPGVYLSMSSSHPCKLCTT